MKRVNMRVIVQALDENGEVSIERIGETHSDEPISVIQQWTAESFISAKIEARRAELNTKVVEVYGNELAIEVEQAKGEAASFTSGKHSADA